ncbi:MAG TPA: ABC transporter ATP-binding protein [Candidatus Saccharimonadales bacterium]|nr:ABC transporter ATP-binding protein [Candidatus Saccharimonadales bacterium]
MSEDIAIKVENVSKTFKLPHEKNSSIKSTVVNFYKRNKSFEIQKALENITFEVKEGEFFGIVGRNGGGKSTLLKMLAGIYEPSSGSIQVNGKLTPFIELGVGFNPELTGRENVFLNGALLGFDRKEMNKMYKDIVKFAELERFMDQKLKNYSSGMQVRLAFSIAIRARSDVLLIDEVLAVGDISFQKKCIDYFKQLKKSQQTIILVSHDMATVEKYCDRALLIHNGEFLDEGDPKEIAAKYRLLNLPSESGHKTKPHPSLFDDMELGEIIINGQQQAVVKEHQELHIEVSYTPRKRKRVITSISICNADGSHIAYYDNSKDRITAEKGKTYQATCVFNTDQFLGGVYVVDVDLYDENGVYLAKKPKAVSFSIMDSDPGKAGLLNIKGHWKVEEE